MYWQALLNEIINKHAEDYPIYYSPIDETPSTVKPKNPKNKNKNKPKQTILDADKKLYLTPREHQCVCLFMDGLTIKQVGQSLELSPRTIEFYLKRIKERFSCRNKIELLNKLLKLISSQVLGGL